MKPKTDCRPQSPNPRDFVNTGSKTNMFPQDAARGLLAALVLILEEGEDEDSSGERVEGPKKYF